MSVSPVLAQSCKPPAQMPALAPISRPTANVSDAATSPKASIREPENSTLRPVKRVVMAPDENNPTPAAAALKTTAQIPPMKNHGNTGRMAPRLNIANELPEATHGFPASSSDM